MRPVSWSIWELRATSSRSQQGVTEPVLPRQGRALCQQPLTLEEDAELQMRSGPHQQLDFNLPKEGVKTERHDHINLKVAGQDGSVVQFEMKRNISLSKLMKAYTPAQLEMEGEDTMDAFQPQTGGVY
ncbi:small ubiquitin-related modifier 2-like [Molossus nigricans]